MRGDEIIEREAEDAINDLQNTPWVMNTQARTMNQIVGEKTQKELLESGYVPPPPKPVRSTTKGRFAMPIATPSELFVKDKYSEQKANPTAWEEARKREQWDKKMLEKKRNQKILKDKLIEE